MQTRNIRALSSTLKRPWEARRNFFSDSLNSKKIFDDFFQRLARLKKNLRRNFFSDSLDPKKSSTKFFQRLARLKKNLRRNFFSDSLESKKSSTNFFQRLARLLVGGWVLYCGVPRKQFHSISTIHSKAPVGLLVCEMPLLFSTPGFCTLVFFESFQMLYFSNELTGLGQCA